jgi:hypothetical protein
MVSRQGCSGKRSGSYSILTTEELKIHLDVVTTPARKTLPYDRNPKNQSAMQFEIIGSKIKKIFVNVT